MKTNWFKRTLCSILAFVMMLGYVPATALAAEEDGPCEHHTQHTAECGYSAAVEGHDCGHEHTDECYQAVTKCVHTHGDCGYVEEAAESPCTYQCEECAKETRFVEAQPNTGGQAQNVFVRFLCNPEQANIAVYSSTVLDAGGQKVRIEPTSDGSYLLPQGDYEYTAACDGWKTIEDGFSIDATEPSVEICVNLEPLLNMKSAAIEYADAGSESGEAAQLRFPLNGTSFHIESYGYLSTQQTYADAKNIYEQYGSNYKSPHHGTEYYAIDISGVGTASVYPIANGTVVHYRSTYGQITLKHTEPLVLQDGDKVYSYSPWYSTYLHMSNIPEEYKKAGAQVSPDISIGNVSNTGLNGGAIHLHFSMTTQIAASYAGIYHWTDPAGSYPATSELVFQYASAAINPRWVFPDEVKTVQVVYDATPNPADVEAKEQFTRGTEYAPGTDLNKAFFRLVDPSSNISPDNYLDNFAQKVTQISRTAVVNGNSANTWKLPWTNSKDGVQDSSLKLGTVSGEIKLIREIVNHVGNVWYEYDTGTSTRGFIYSGDVTVQISAPFYKDEEITVSNITNDNAILKTNIHNPSCIKLVSGGVRVGTSPGIFTQKKPFTIPASYQTAETIPCSYNLKTECGFTLQPGTTYFFQFFVKSEDGTEYSSVVDTFKTTGTASTPVSSISLSPSSKTLNVGDTVQLTATVSPSNATNKSLTWSSSNASVATVSSTGLVTAKGVGSATITATATDGSGKSATANITVEVSTVVIASGSCGANGDNVTYILTKDGTLTISGSGKMENYPDDSVAPWYDNRTEITSVVLTDGVTSIGSYAFYDCTSLTSITISEGITSIEEGAFFGCTNLTSITIPKGVTSIESWVFYNCTSLTSITIPKGITSIGEGAFYDCTSLTSLTIPEGVTSIGEGAFYDCTSLTSITIPKGVTSIESWVFYNCTSLTSITIPEGIASIGDSAFEFCNSLTSITIPEGVTSIGIYAFGHCSSLTSIAIPQRVTSIERYTFSCCTSLTSITIPEGITSIGEGAFYDCISLTSITIPEGVTSIGSYAFYDCTSLISITIPEKVTSIGSYAFYNCESLTSIMIPEGVTSIESYAFYRCERLTSVTIPEGVTSIGSHAFGDCSSLTSVAISEGVTSIGEAAFSNCTSLTSITIPKGVTSIGIWAFANCASLTSITIPEGVTSIGGYTFGFCSSLTSVTIPEGVTSIGWCAFYDCTSLTSVTIPKGVTSIGEEAFSGCANLTTVHFLGDGFTSTDDVFNNAVTAYYPRGNATWTQAIRDSFGSLVTWVEAGAEGTSPFVDVPTNAYYFNAVQWAVENKITAGTSDTTFSPDAPCTRAQAVSFLWRAAGRPTPTSSQMTFADVAPDSYYRTAVLWAVENKITSGTSAATFSPDATCTRAQIVSFLCRAFGKPGSANTSFTDVPADAYYAGAVSWAVANGVTAGTGDGKFSPDADCTRGQIVSFLYRCRDKM